MQGNLTALLITAGIILAVVCIGFIAGGNKQSRKSVEEWSVGGRRFGGVRSSGFSSAPTCIQPTRF